MDKAKETTKEILRLIELGCADEDTIKRKLDLFESYIRTDQAVKTSDFWADEITVVNR